MMSGSRLIEVYLTVDKCLNWIRKELFEESEFLVIYLVEMVMYSPVF